LIKANTRMGFHSNDARRGAITESPADPTTKLGASPPLVRTRGAEAGIRARIVPGFDSSVSLFILDRASLFKQCFPVQIAPAAVYQAGVMDHILHPAEPAGDPCFADRGVLSPVAYGL
jgi:hypothetical protein